MKQFKNDNLLSLDGNTPVAPETVQIPSPLRIEHANGALEILYPDGGYTYADAQGHTSYRNADGSGGWMTPDGAYGWWDNKGNGGSHWADGSYDSWYADGSSDWNDGNFSVLCQHEHYKRRLQETSDKKDNPSSRIVDRVEQFELQFRLPENGTASTIPPKAAVIEFDPRL